MTTGSYEWVPTTEAALPPLPLGHLLGTFFTDPASDAHQTLVRFGSTVHSLTDPELAAWLLIRGPATPLRGPSDRGGSARWTVASPGGFGTARPLASPAPIEPLVERGLIALVPDGAEDRTAFALAHRVVPLVVQLGNIGADRAAVRFGRRGEAVAAVSAPTALVCWLSPVHPTLWHACEAAAEESDVAASTLLDAVLDALPGLLAADAVMLDEPWTGPPPSLFAGMVMTPLPRRVPSAFLFPIGQFGGSMFDLRSGGLLGRSVRIGVDDVEFEDELAVVAWQLAHGTGPDRAAWTRQHVAEAFGSWAAARPPTDPLRKAGPDDVDAAVDRLIEAGQLVEVEPDTDRAAEFARSYRLVHLHSGLGNTTEMRALSRVGLATGRAFTHVNQLDQDLWQTSWSDRSLHHTYARLAEARRHSPDSPWADPNWLAQQSFGALRCLLGAAVAYLDAARPA